jgi:spore maturation protein CgeB
MNILYSFNKKGFEANYWAAEIAAASDPDFTFIPFNHDPYVDVFKYIRAQLLDNLYYDRHPGLMRMYSDFEAILRERRISAVIVDTCPPYHPDYLRNIPVYKVLRIGDGPISAYDRDLAYCHAYHHVLYHSPAYSRDLDTFEKLRYCKVERADFWPMCAFDALFDRSKTEQTILDHRRDIDVIFIGTLHLSKMPFLAKVKKALGSRIQMRGLCSPKKNVYYNLKYGFPGWMRRVPFEQYVPLYQRAKIGITAVILQWVPTGCSTYLPME